MSTSNRGDRVAAKAQALVDQKAFSGIQWRVDRGGETWLAGRAGWADALSGRAMEETPIFRIYSMTKPLISVLALMLVERGQLRLYDQLQAIIPAFANRQVVAEDGSRRAAAGPILIEHLMTHRAGLSYSFLPGCPVGALYGETTMFDASHSLAEMIDIIAAHPLAFDPGTAWRYSVATDVLARVIEVVSGEDLATILTREVLAPLGLVDTAYRVPADQRHRVMAIFGSQDLKDIFNFTGLPQQLTPVTEIEKQYPVDSDRFWRGGHGLYSTVDDYMKVAKFLGSGVTADGSRLLSRKMVDLMWTNRVPAAQRPLRIGPAALPGYGFGLTGRVMVDMGQALSLTSLDEGGWAGAASTYFWVDRHENMFGVVMSQYLGSQIPLADDIRQAVYQALD